MNKKILVSGLALFSMFFGAGNLIFPATLGLMAESHFPAATLGFLFTAVGLIFFAVLATIKAGGSIQDIGKPVGPVFSTIFGSAVMLSIGPLLAIPRTAAVTVEVIQGSMFPNISIIIGTIVFFLVALFFAINPATVIDRLGKILTPALLISLALIIIRGIMVPMSVPTGGEANMFSFAFEEGYQTLDALAALAFTFVIIQGFRIQGITDQKELEKSSIGSGIIAVVGLSLIYAGLIYVGAKFASQDVADLSRVELLIHISNTLLGSYGGIIISVAMALACLTTAIGLLTTTAEYFSTLVDQKINYRQFLILFTLISTFFGIRGVDNIIKVSAPILVTLYPVAMVLIFFNLFEEKFNRRSTHLGGVLGALIFQLTQTFEILELNFVPASLQSFAWIVPAVVLALIFTAAGIGDKSQPTS